MGPWPTGSKNDWRCAQGHCCAVPIKSAAVRAALLVGRKEVVQHRLGLPPSHLVLPHMRNSSLALNMQVHIAWRVLLCVNEYMHDGMQGDMPSPPGNPG